MPADCVKQETDIAIVGGGMVGISLALLLAAQNQAWSITLVEAFPLGEGQPVYQPSFDARSTALAAGAAPLLQAMGVWPRLSKHLTPIRKVHVSDKGHFGGTEINAEAHRLDAVGYVVENRWLGAVLADALVKCPQIRVLAPAQVSAIAPMPGGYALTVQQSSQFIELFASLAIVADGEVSAMRQQLGIAHTVRQYDQRAIIANVALSQPHQGIAYERFTATGPIALLPMGESDGARQAALVWTHPKARADHWLACTDSAFLAELQRSFGFRAGRFVKVGQRHCYELALIQAQEQVRSHLAVMGNAAHFLHPVAGQGFNLSLRDCAVLAETLGVGERCGRVLGDLETLQQYAARQLADQQLTVGFSDRLVRAFSSDVKPLAVLRSMGLLTLDVLPPAKQWLSEQTMGMAGHLARTGEYGVNQS